MNTKSYCPAVERMRPRAREIRVDVTTLVGKEILRDDLDPGTWAIAVSTTDGNHQKAIAAYARMRIEDLTDQRNQSAEKRKSFDARRVSNCSGVKTVQEILKRCRSNKQMNFFKPRLSPVSLLILGMGTTGAVASFNRLFVNTLPTSLANNPLSSAVFAGAVAVIIALLLRFKLPKRWVMLGWNSGLTSACVIVCFLSLMSGVKLIAKAPPLEPQRMATHTNIAPATESMMKQQVLPEEPKLVAASARARK